MVARWAHIRQKADTGSSPVPATKRRRPKRSLSPFYAISFTHLENAVKSAGFYELTDNADFKELLGLNYSRFESYIESFTADEIQAEFDQAGWKEAKAFELNAQGKVQINQLKATEYWRILLILALIFVAIEILLLKLWKR